MKIASTHLIIASLFYGYLIALQLSNAMQCSIATVTAVHVYLLVL